MTYGFGDYLKQLNLEFEKMTEDLFTSIADERSMMVTYLIAKNIKENAERLHSLCSSLHQDDIITGDEYGKSLYYLRLFKTKYSSLNHQLGEMGFKRRKGDDHGMEERDGGIEIDI